MEKRNTPQSPSSVTEPVYTKPVQTQQAVSQNSLILLMVFLVALTGIVVFLLLRPQTAETNPNGYDPELEALKAQLASKRLSLGLSENSDTATSLTAEGLTTSISNNAQTLAQLLREIDGRLSAKDGIISQKNSEIDNAARLRQSLNDEIASLKKQLDELRLSATSNSALERRLKDSQMLLNSSNQEIARLRSLLGQAPSSAALQALESRIALLEEERDRLRKALENTADPNTVNDLRRENRQLRLELLAFKSDANRSRLFAERADLLSPKGLALYNQLTTLEGNSNEARLRAYETIKTSLNASVVETVGFATGSSSIDIEKATVIQQGLAATNPGSEYLIVGYASKSGDATSNRELSSKRATTVATLADLERGSTQVVKAVFLGQTNRFSKTNDYSNQVCEIWEIKPTL